MGFLRLGRKDINLSKANHICRRCKVVFTAPMMKGEETVFCPRCSIILRRIGDAEKKIIQSGIALENDEAKALKRIFSLIGKKHGQPISDEDEEVINYLVERLANDAKHKESIVRQLKELQATKNK